MKIANECVVAFHYTLSDDSGQELDSSKGQEPMQYVHGVGGLIPGLEQELEGREAGDAFQAVVQPEDAYGPVDPGLIQDVPLDMLSGVDNLEVGMRLQSQSSDGRVHLLTVEAVGAETATLNGNHVLAGEVLHFDVSVESVRQATAAELEEGLKG